MVLGCDAKGCVKTIALDSVEMERTMGDNGFRGKSMRLIRALRKLLIDYSEEHGYGILQLNNNRTPFICTVSVVNTQTAKASFNGLNVRTTGNIFGWQDGGADVERPG
jgi:hypothetical protein